jgi:hypothetical protein
MPPPRLPFRFLTPLKPRLLYRSPYRPFSTPSQPPKPPSPPQQPPNQPSRELSRLSRLNSRLPRFLQSVTTPLLSAPVSHITSFLILHELTAIIPLVGLTATFHYTKYLPPWFAEGKWVSDGVEKFGRYFKKKGWLGPTEERELERGNVMGEDGKVITGTGGVARRGQWWNRGEGGVRLVVETATAYAIVKALLPVRIGVSVWGAPWFASLVVMPIGRRIGRVFVRG